jgi:hypothetical protein
MAVILYNIYVYIYIYIYFFFFFSENVAGVKVEKVEISSDDVVSENLSKTITKLLKYW